MLTESALHLPGYPSGYWADPVKALPLLRCEAALTGADQYPTPAAHAILSVIIPHIKQDSSRAIAVFITLCCFPLLTAGVHGYFLLW